jgi:hypothetical protein
MIEVQGSFFALMMIVLLTIIIIVTLVQVFSTFRAKSNLMREEAYRKLSEQATTAEQKAVDEQKKISESLEDIRVRLAAIEKMLREVE